jgi:hypothetical protein
LSVPVQGNWKTCHLSLPPFVPAWENLEEAWQKTTVAAQEEVSHQSRFSRGESISCPDQLDQAVTALSISRMTS